MMMGKKVKQRFLTLLVASLALTMVYSAIPLQANQKEAVQEAKSPTKQASKPRKPRGRLPVYYSQVVNEEQRLKIYAIQAQHMQKIADLRAQLATALKAMNSEVETVLTDEQREKVDQLAKEAAEKRKAKSTPQKTTVAK
jgi:hypothetical protein